MKIIFFEKKLAGTEKYINVPAVNNRVFKLGLIEDKVPSIVKNCLNALLKACFWILSVFRDLTVLFIIDLEISVNRFIFNLGVMDIRERNCS